MFFVFDKNKFKAMRLRRGLTIDALVEKANKRFTRGAVSSWETGRYKPTDDTVVEILRALDCDWEDIARDARAS